MGVLSCNRGGQQLYRQHAFRKPEVTRTGVADLDAMHRAYAKFADALCLLLDRVPPSEFREYADTCTALCETLKGFISLRVLTELDENGVRDADLFK